MSPEGVSEAAVNKIRQRFLTLAGLSHVDVRVEQTGPELFLRFRVGRDAILYRYALAAINEELPPDDPFHGRLSLEIISDESILPTSTEIDLLRSLITRSLRVTRDATEKAQIVEFVPFRGREETRAAQPANHAIVGRRGVGKSSLILAAYRRVRADRHIPIWLDLQPYRGRGDPRVAIEILSQFFREALLALGAQPAKKTAEPLTAALRLVEKAPTAGEDSSFDAVKALIPQLHGALEQFTRSQASSLYLFLDDAHFLDIEAQPRIFELIFSVLKGAAAWLKVAGVKSLLRLYDPSTKTGLQPPHDIQLIPLDLTLVDPSAARDHLTSILRKFLELCGIPRSGEVVGNSAIDRLVWCSAGVPRDFLWLFERSAAFAVQHRRESVGVQEVNLAVGEFGQEKMAELDQDTSTQAEALRAALDRLVSAVLDEHKANSFLIRHDTKHEGYKAIQKLMDLRLIHLIHPSITPSKSGERFEAYLLDYSFYTGLRRRHGITELKIKANEPPKYEALRRLPRIDLTAIVPAET